MASITYDGQSFTINGRRRWLVGATIDFGRLDRDQWHNRLRAARQAGFNTIGVRVCWAQHEKSPGDFDFKGDLDLRAFIMLIAQERMLAVLRPGPFIDAGWDAGGLPGWLIDGKPEIARTGDPQFKEAASRWIAAVMRQVRDLQLTASGAGGPIALIQNDHAWFRGDADGAAEAIGESARFLREAGATAPIINANNLFAAAEGEIDGWLGGDHLFTTLRQLRAVRPEAPPIAIDVPVADLTAHGEATPERDRNEVIRTLAQALAAGGQFLIDPLCAGLTPGFLAGRDPMDARRHFASSYAPGAPIDFGGGRTKLYAAIKRIASFACNFERVLTGLRFDEQSIVLRPDEAHSNATVVPVAGTQGSCAFVFAPQRGRAAPVELLLPDGRSLTTDVSFQPVSILLFDALIGKRATLDYCNLSAFACVGEVFVCYGKAGAHASFSVNGTPVEATVPGGKAPLVMEHEDVTIVICSEEQIDATYFNDDAVFVGCGGLDETGAPLPAPSFTTCTRINCDGASGTIQIEREPKPRKRPSMTGWTAAAEPALQEDGARFASINAIAPNAQLGAPFGYLWLKLALRAAKGRRCTVGFFGLQNRALLYLNGKPLRVVGAILNGEDRLAPLSIPKGDHTLTMLVDHFGRPSGGAALGEAIGLQDDLWEVGVFRLNKPKLVTTEPVSPVKSLPSRVWDLHDDELTDPRRIEWTFTYRRQAPLYFTFDGPPAPALVLLNDHPITWLAAGGPSSVRLPDASLRRGANTLQLAVFGDAAAALEAFAKATTAHECKAPLMKDASWSMAPWSVPDEAKFESVTKAAMAEFAGSPVWWRCGFTHTPDDPAICFEPTGLSKGQVLLNGRNVGRYVASNGKKKFHVTPLVLPSGWMKADGDNELVIFDEFGASPEKCKLLPVG